MSGNLRPDEKRPTIDLWRPFLENDDSNFNKRNNSYGQLFLKDDREQAKQTIYKVIEMSLMPFIAKRIVDVNEIVAKTKKGFKNTVFNMFKKADRGENDGERANFKMNKQDIELRTLVDLSFIVQDYDTVLRNVSYPVDEFSKIRAFKHVGHLDELKLYAKMVKDPNLLRGNFKDFVSDADKIFHTYHKKAQGAQWDMVKFVIFITEIY